MKKLLASLYENFLALFGVESDIDTIVSPITKIVAKLDAHHDRKVAEADAAISEIARLEAESQAHLEDSVRASRLSKNVAAAFGM